MDVKKEITDEDFKKFGFDIYQEPFRKKGVDGEIVVYKNYIRDGSDRYDGYIVIEPRVRMVRTIGDFVLKNDTEK